MKIHLTLLALLILLAPACQGIGVEQVSPGERAKQERLSVLDTDDVSIATRGILARRGITDYRHDPVGAIRRLDKEIRTTKDRKLAAAISELAYLQTRRVNVTDRKALATAVRYSYAYLFDPQLEPEPQPFDGRFRWACDMYNTALADLLRHYKDVTKIDTKDWNVSWYTGSTTARIGTNDLAWEPHEFSELLIADDMHVSGLEPPETRTGIGVPCLMKRAWDGATRAQDHHAKYHYLPKEVAFPATIVLRLPDDASILDETPSKAAFDIFDPMQTVELSIAGRTVPLEMDYTTPLAAIVEKRGTPSGLSALLHVNEYTAQSGLFMFQPYNPDRIMVIFVHGLASGPETWVPLYNQLLADEKIRTRFQFAFWFYPTGAPALSSAVDLRKALDEAHDLLGAKSRLKQATDSVIVAHSLGGILSSTLVTDSGNKLWDTMFTVPPEKLPVKEEYRQHLRDMLIFNNLPWFKRVVYFSCPHRGAPEAATGFMKWASGLIHLPKDLLGPEHAIHKFIQKDMRYKRFTVAQSLAPHNPVMEALTDLRPAKGVVVNSIIGDEHEAGKKGGSDGLVPYWSSHLDYSESELIIQSGHSTEHKPAGARELRRILHEHLAELDKASK